VLCPDLSRRAGIREDLARAPQRAAARLPAIPDLYRAAGIDRAVLGGADRQPLSRAGLCGVSALGRLASHGRERHRRHPVRLLCLSLPDRELLALGRCARRASGARAAERCAAGRARLRGGDRGVLHRPWVSGQSRAYRTAGRFLVSALLGAPGGDGQRAGADRARQDNARLGHGRWQRARACAGRVFEERDRVESGGRLPDTVVYFAGAYESQAARTLAAKASLDHHYEAHGTAIRLWSSRAVDPASPLGSVLAPAAANEYPPLRNRGAPPVTLESVAVTPHP